MSQNLPQICTASAEVKICGLLKQMQMLCTHLRVSRPIGEEERVELVRVELCVPRNHVHAGTTTRQATNLYVKLQSVS